MSNISTHNQSNDLTNSNIQLQNEYQTMSHTEHLLKYPELVLGRVDMHMEEIWLLNPQAKKLIHENIIYNSAIERLFLEILYNAADNVQRSRDNNMEPGDIKVMMNKNTIRIVNQGRPISCQKQPNTDMHIPSFIFGKLMTSSNYDKTQKRTMSGTYGLGAKCSNLFSTYFKIDIINKLEGVKFSQVWKNNMSIVSEPKIESINPDQYPSSSTTITYICDFSRFYDDDLQFGFSTKREYTNEIMLAFAKHCIDASLTANVPVYFNDTMFDCTGEEGIRKYAAYYYPDCKNSLIFTSNDSVCLLLDTPDKASTISFVNSVLNNEGGIHVDTWKKGCFKPILDTLVKKYAGIKIHERDISEHITMILSCKLINPRFKHQTKDKLTSPRPTLIANLYEQCEELKKWDAFMTLEETLALRMNAISKKSDGRKNRIADVDKLIDAGEAGGPNSQKCTLYITEGDSAANFAIKGIKDGGYTGALPIKGKLLNVGNCDIQTYAGNTEIAMIKKALGLQEGLDYNDPANLATLRYGKVRIMSDQDVDGMHIRGLVHNFFRLKFPSLLSAGFVEIMETPLLRVKVGRHILPFYYQKDYDNWVNDPNVTDAERIARKKLAISYYKGLGSSDDSELLDAFEKGMPISYKYDDKSEELMAIAYDPEHEDDRKEWVMSWNADEHKATYGDVFPIDTLASFVTNQLCEHAHINTQRCIPSVVDGLKECQRKVITVLLNLPQGTLKKVSQLKGLVSDQMHYKYGDEALYRTIVGLGNYYAGSNNIPLIKAKGQYDSRYGKKAAKDRYIFAAPSPLLKYIIRKEDTCILEYKKDGSANIEPKHYYPILPLFLLNGSRGIATGFSTNIPAYDPLDLMKYISWWISIRMKKTSESDENPPPEIKPWYRNYQGEIKNINGHWYSIGSFREIQSKKRVKDIVVTELPVTMTIENYVEILKKLKEKPIMNIALYEKGMADAVPLPEEPIDNTNLIAEEVQPKPKRGRKKKENDPNATEVKSSPKTRGKRNVEPTNNVPSGLEVSPSKKKAVSSKKCPTYITNYKVVANNMEYKYKGEKYVEVLPNIIVEGALCVTASKQGALRALGLIEKISDTNVVLLDENYKPTEYDSSIYKAFNNYCEVRYKAYVLRRKRMMEEWSNDIKYLELKIRFIQDVIDEKIRFRNEHNKPKNKATLEQEVTSMGYYVEFLKMAVSSMTEEGIAHIQDEINKIAKKYEHYKVTSAGKLWLNELEELYNNM